MIKIFISYARADKKRVQNFYKKLKNAGYKPWMDTNDISAGEKWWQIIEKAIKDSNFFITCETTNSANKRGFYHQQEINTALAIYKEEALRTDVFIIPVKLEKFETPPNYDLSEFQRIELYEKNGWEKLCNALNRKQRRRTLQGTKLNEKGTSEYIENKVLLYFKLNGLSRQIRNVAGEIFANMKRSNIKRKYNGEFKKMLEDFVDVLNNDVELLRQYSFFELAKKYENGLQDFQQNMMKSQSISKASLKKISNAYSNLKIAYEQFNKHIYDKEIQKNKDIIEKIFFEKTQLYLKFEKILASIKEESFRIAYEVKNVHNIDLEYYVDLRKTLADGVSKDMVVLSRFSCFEAVYEYKRAALNFYTIVREKHNNKTLIIKCYKNLEHAYNSAIGHLAPQMVSL